MIEKVIYDYLSNILDCAVYLEEPAVKPKKYVLFSKIDQGKVNQIKSATISIYSCAESLFESASLDEIVQDAMYMMVELDNISSVKLGGGSPAIDTQTKSYRYESIFNIYYT